MDAWGQALRGQNEIRAQDLERLFGALHGAQQAQLAQSRQPRGRGCSKRASGVRRAIAQHPHPIFSAFRPFEGLVPAGFFVDYLGAMVRTRFQNSEPTPAEPSFVTAPVPQVSEEYFEYVDLLQSVACAVSQFTMIELGAGYGRWLVRAACALRRTTRLPLRLLGVEAEPEHFKWMALHFADNGLCPANHRLIEAAVAARDGEVSFYTGNPVNWYGQAIAPEQTSNSPDIKRVPAISLQSLLAGLGEVDLIDMDVQGAEYEVLGAAATEIDLQVKRLHIGTHSHEVEAGIRDLFGDLGWLCLNDYPCLSKNMTPFGQVEFQDGVQTWLNPKLA